MPIYEYRCENGHTFEVMQRMSDPPVTTCEIDGGPVERVFTAPAVHFKGSGFYSTDYGSKNRARELKEAGEGKGKYEKDAGGSSSSSSSSDSSTSSDSGSSNGASSSNDGKSDNGSSNKSAKSDTKSSAKK